MERGGIATNNLSPPISPFAKGVGEPGEGAGFGGWRARARRLFTDLRQEQSIIWGAADGGGGRARWKYEKAVKGKNSDKSLFTL